MFATASEKPQSFPAKLNSDESSRRDAKIDARMSSPAQNQFVIDRRRNISTLSQLSLMLRHEKIAARSSAPLLNFPPTIGAAIPKWVHISPIPLPGNETSPTIFVWSLGGSPIRAWRAIPRGALVREHSVSASFH
jgi:hypothetical protein